MAEGVAAAQFRPPIRGSEENSSTMKEARESKRGPWRISVPTIPCGRVRSWMERGDGVVVVCSWGWNPNVVFIFAADDVDVGCADGCGGGIG